MIGVTSQISEALSNSQNLLNTNQFTVQKVIKLLMARILDALSEILTKSPDFGGPLESILSDADFKLNFFKTSLKKTVRSE